MQHREIKSLLDKRQLDDAEKIIQSSNLESAVLLPLKIELLFLRQCYKDALNIAEQMLHDAPDSAVAYRWKAEILDDGFHDYKSSMECSTKAIELDPSYADAYVIRGNAKRWINPADNKGAIEDYNSALKYDKSNAGAFSGIGWALLEMPGKLDEALQKFTTALCHDQDSFAAYQGISYAFYKKGQLDKAIEYINKAIELNPNAYYLYESRALYKKALAPIPADEVFDDYCLAFQKTPIKRDFNIRALLDSAVLNENGAPSYDHAKAQKIAGAIWCNIDNLPQREDILDFHILLLMKAEGEWLDLIVNKGIPADYRSPTGRIFLHETISLCDLEIIKKIQFAKALTTKLNEQGLTPLGVAVQADKIDVGKYLLSMGSSPDERIAEPWQTPFMMAIALNKTAWIDLFLENGANINHVVKPFGSYLAFACEGGHWEIARKLLEYGAEPNPPGFTGTPPLSFCNQETNKEIVEFLLDKGAKLEYACLRAENLQNKRKEVLKRNVGLIKNSASPDSFNDFFACLRAVDISKKELEIIQRAINEKPDLFRDENRRLAMQMAESCQSSIKWPEDDAYPLITTTTTSPKSNPLPKLKIPRMVKEEPTEQSQTGQTAAKDGQSQTGRIYPGSALFAFVPFWIATKSFIAAVALTAVIYVVLYIIKAVVEGSSR